MHRHLILFSIHISIAFAEPSLVVSENSLASLVHSQNPELKAARWKIQEALGKWQQAGRHSRPKLNIDIEHDARIQEGELRIGLARSFPLTNRLAIEKNISKSKLEAAEWEIKHAEQEILRNARILFVRALALKGQQDSLTSSQQEAKRFAELIAQRQTRAEASPLDSAQAKLDAASLTIERQQIQAEQSNVLAELKKLLGFPPELPLTLNGELRPPSLASHGNPTKRPDYQASLVQIHRAKSIVQREYANRIDDMDASIFLSGMRREDAPEGLQSDLMVGFQLSIPLPFWDDNSGNIAAANANVNRRQQEASNTLQNAHHDATSANAEMKQWRELDQQIRTELLPLAQQQLDLAQQAYQQGQGDLSEIFRARAQKRQLNRTHIETLSAYHQARIRYQSALGNPSS